ncbi:hypothetical protein BAE44_0026159 [Dichanthelium oligosanthes]|uniref:Uncharacterized protein n=1 Tax=Dichanthelium oligosanthes TaxID=888268 RepID=A0A1E5UIW9_9POAL|nr:hypothetical protein BAE44_0026159 [Dichanthelium oligosanthes]
MCIRDRAPPLPTAALPAARQVQARGLLSSTGGVSKRTLGGRGGAASVRAVDGASAVAAVTAAADAPLPPAQVTWHIVISAVGGSRHILPRFLSRVAQKKYEFCGGSGLVMKKDYYIRCQGFGWNRERNAVDRP